MSGHEKWIELADIYAAGALDGSDLQEFSAHLPGCQICRNHVHQTEEALASIPGSLSLVEAPAVIKSRLMEEIGEPALAGAGAPAFSMSWAAGAVLACLCIALGTAFFQTRQKMMDYKKVADHLSEADTQLVSLSAMDPSPRAFGKMVWNPKKCEGVFMAMNLSKLPEGMVYELWAISGSTPVPAGTFTVDAGGCVKMDLKEMPKDLKVDKFAVTLEPAGGVPQPTGAMHLIGAV